MIRTSLAWVFAAAALYAGTAAAATNVGVLEFDGTNVTKEFLAEGSKAIRETIVGPRFESKYTVSGGDKLSKLIVLLNCSTTDNVCLKKIADGLKASILIFGEVKQPQKGSYDVEMTMFNGTSTTNIRQKGITASQFAPVVSSLASELLGVSPLAYLDLDSNIKTAVVTVDGVKQEKTVPMRLELAPGVHKISVSAPTYTTAEQDIELAVGVPKSITIALSKEGKILNQNVPPIARALQFGGGGAFVVGIGAGVSFLIGSSRAKALVNANGTIDQAAAGITPEQERDIFAQIDPAELDGLKICSAAFTTAVKAQRDNPIDPANQLDKKTANKILIPCYMEWGGVPGLVLGVGGAVGALYGFRIQSDALKGKTKGKETSVTLTPYLDSQNIGATARIRW